MFTPKFAGGVTFIIIVVTPLAVETVVELTVNERTGKAVVQLGDPAALFEESIGTPLPVQSDKNVPGPGGGWELLFPGFEPRLTPSTPQKPAGITSAGVPGPDPVP
jgi:hypothetical protein